MKLPIFHPIVKEEDDEKDKKKKQKDKDKELKERKRIRKKEYSSQLSSGFHLSCLFPVSTLQVVASSLGSSTLFSLSSISLSISTSFTI
jgi:hypothetical protein